MRYGKGSDSDSSAGGGPADGLDDRRKVGAGIGEQDIDAELGKARNEGAGTALMRICAHDFGSAGRYASSAAEGAAIRRMAGKPSRSETCDRKKFCILN
jgi:hypothetical protein